MSVVSREPIFAAIFALAKNATTFQTASRVLANPDQLMAAACPALYQEQVEQIPTRKLGTGLPTKYKFGVRLWIVVDAGADQNIVPTTLLNNAQDALEAALAPVREGERQTLGGLVYDAGIVDKIEVHEGVFGGKSLAIVPVEILV